MIENKINFKVSNKCCFYAKKKVAIDFIKDNDFDLNCVGIRKAERGARSVSFKNCFSDNSDKNKPDDYRPLFWFTDADKKEYEEFYCVEHSECYSKYGLKRTGCCGCPYSVNLENELEAFKKI